MPRKPTAPAHPLRTIRIATGMTQKAFAEMVGVSAETILSIELGRMKMPSDLALKIRVETGCCLRGSENGRGERRFDVQAIATETLEKYRREDFLEHRGAMKEFYSSNPDELVDISRGASRAIDLLIHAASRSGKVLAFVKDLENFLVKSFESYRLKDGLLGHVKDTFVDAFRDADPGGSPEDALKNFPLAPLSTAFSFASSVEQAFAANGHSHQKVMPK